MHPSQKERKGAEQRFWPAETPTRELGWSQLKSNQNLELAYMLIWSELVLMSTRISGNANCDISGEFEIFCILSEVTHIRKLENRKSSLQNC